VEFPNDLKYTENDEWIRVEGDMGTIGISDFAQDQLSDIVYVEITAAVGDEVEIGEAFALVESVKAASDVYLPVTGKITEINEALVDTPELMNSDPYGEAWLVKLELSDPSQLTNLLDVEDYKKSVEDRSD
jgi:glycine cleavage system H protein